MFFVEMIRKMKFISFEKKNWRICSWNYEIDAVKHSIECYVLQLCDFRSLGK